MFHAGRKKKRKRKCWVLEFGEEWSFYETLLVCKNWAESPLTWKLTTLHMHGESKKGMFTFFCAVASRQFGFVWFTCCCMVMTLSASLFAPSVAFFFLVLFAQQCHSSSGGHGRRQAHFVVTCVASPSATRLTCSVTRCSMQQCGMSTFVTSARGPFLGRVASRDTSVTCMPRWPVVLECSAMIHLVRVAHSPMWGDILVALTSFVSHLRSLCWMVWVELPWGTLILSVSAYRHTL